MSKSKVLVVDDEAWMLEVLRDTLGELPEVEVLVEENSHHAADVAVANSWDLLITDVRMPGMGGVELARRAREAQPDLAVLMLTAFPEVDSAVESMKVGAVDYLTKPFEPDHLLETVRSILEERKDTEEKVRRLRRRLAKEQRFGEIIGKSEAMAEVFATIEKVATSDLDVLVLGETGTGKELVARCLHERSRRADGRFVPVDCGAIPEDLLESELFGHERGAFTGAHQRSRGLLEFANQGTFFMDEIGQLPPKLQAKLLRALQERRIRRVGGKEEVNVDVRILAATALDLDLAMKEGRFREDLYYRINVARVEVPPLRDRVEDIPLLAGHFLDQYSRELGREGVEFDGGVLDALCAYSWPGNIRELQNVVKRTLVTSGSDLISVEDLPPAVAKQAPMEGSRDRRGFFAARDRKMTAFERQYLTDLLHAHDGEVTRAAEVAEVPRGTLYRLLKKHGIDPGEFRG